MELIYSKKNSLLLCTWCFKHIECLCVFLIRITNLKARKLLEAIRSKYDSVIIACVVHHFATPLGLVDEFFMCPVHLCMHSVHLWAESSASMMKLSASSRIKYALRCLENWHSWILI